MDNFTIRRLQEEAEKLQQETYTAPLHQVTQRITLEDIKLMGGLERLNPTSERKQLLIQAASNAFSAAYEAESDFAVIQGCICFYNGFYWETIDEMELKVFLMNLADESGAGNYLALHYRFVEDLKKQFELFVPNHKPKERSEKVLINLLNGTYEIHNGKAGLRAFTKNDYLTYQLPFAYKPGAAAPRFAQFLDTVLPDKACQQIIAEYIAYTFTDLKLEKVLISYGTGANGKSVIFEIVNALLGKENISNYSLASLCSEYQRAQLGDKLLNYASEIDQKVERSLFKILASGEPIDARHPYSKPFIMQKYCKFWFNSNEMFSNPEITEGFFRRLLVIPFSVTIPEEQRNPHLAKTIIAEELPGIFNWVLEGLQRLLSQNGFTKSETVENFLKNYQLQSDSVQQFIEEEGYRKCPDNGILLCELYPEYRLFCSDNGNQPLAKKKFNERLKNLGVIVEKRRDGNTVLLEKTPLPQF